MDPSLLVGATLIAIGVLLSLALVAAVSVLFFWRLREGSRRPAEPPKKAAKAGEAGPKSAPPAAQKRPASTPPPASVPPPTPPPQRTPSVPPAASGPGSAPPPPPGLQSVAPVVGSGVRSRPPSAPPEVEPTTRMAMPRSGHPDEATYGSAPPTADQAGKAPNLLGFFDEEPSTGRKTKEEARTELFQRGAQNFDWDDDDDDEGGATEVFSAHHLADEMGSDFDIDDEDAKKKK